MIQWFYAINMRRGGSLQRMIFIRTSGIRGGGAMWEIRRKGKTQLVIVIIGVVASLVSAGAAVIRLVYDIRKDKKQESNPPSSQG